MIAKERDEKRPQSVRMYEWKTVYLRNQRLKKLVNDDCERVREMED